LTRYADWSIIVGPVGNINTYSNSWYFLQKNVGTRLLLKSVKWKYRALIGFTDAFVVLTRSRFFG
jgi:hypothetical protein